MKTISKEILEELTNQDILSGIRNLNTSNENRNLMFQVLEERKIIVDWFEVKNIEKVKTGTFFKLKPESNIVYIRSGYNRSTKRYEAYKYDDTNSFREFKKGKQIIVGFTF